MNFYPLFLQAAQEPESPNFLIQFGPLLLLVFVFYMFLIRPQQKRQKQLRTYREQLQKGDKIITTGGIYGRVHEIKENNKVVMEICDNVRITVDKSAVVMDMTDSPK
ncbi:MAG: preprotein translocase subunit YajC [Marinilabiliaceae bacterium]|nr:preprotein translocase subunit YajC [Marinilabiliaceae bacterium]